MWKRIEEAHRVMAEILTVSRAEGMRSTWSNGRNTNGVKSRGVRSTWSNGRNTNGVKSRERVGSTWSNGRNTNGVKSRGDEKHLALGQKC